LHGFIERRSGDNATERFHGFFVRDLADTAEGCNFPVLSCCLSRARSWLAPQRRSLRHGLYAILGKAELRGRHGKRE
jgi:hypothetical protein